MPPVPTISTIKGIHTCSRLSNLRKSGNKHLQEHVDRHIDVRVDSHGARLTLQSAPYLRDLCHPVRELGSGRGPMFLNRSRWPACSTALTRAASKSRNPTRVGLSTEKLGDILPR